MKPTTSDACRNVNFTIIDDFIGFKTRIEELFKRGSLKYVYCQIEKGENGVKHLQGMAMTHHPQRSSYWNKNFGDAWKRIGGSNKDLRAAYEYCHKERTRVEADYIDLGKFVMAGNAKMHFTTTTAIDYCNAHGEELLSMDVHNTEMKLLEDGVAFETRKRILNEQADMKRLHGIAAAREAALNTTWNPWQQAVVDTVLNAPVDPRRVTVVLDEAGNCGKTFLAGTWTKAHPENSTILMNGKSADMLCAMMKKKDVETVFIDLTRTTHGIINYQTIESIKNGIFMNPKYDSNIHIGQPKRIIILTNEALNWNAMSKDRWQILYIKNGNHTWHSEASWRLMGGAQGIEGIRRFNDRHYDNPKSHNEPCPTECYMAHEHVREPTPPGEENIFNYL